MRSYGLSVPSRRWYMRSLLALLAVCSFGTGAVAIAPQTTITMMQSQGEAPFTAHVHALTSTFGTGDQLTAHVEWDFGDPGSSYNTLTGWNAAHQYASPGTYTITCTITNELGEISTTSRNIEVVSSTRSTVYVAANGSDGNPGSFNAPVRTLEEAFSRVTDGTAVLFRRGDVFDVDTSGILAGSNVYIGAYGTGVRPVLRWTGPTGFSAIIKMSLGNHHDITVQDITFTSQYGADDDRDIVDAIIPAGTNITVRDCVFGEVSLAINGNRSPVGLLLQNCSAGEIGAYLVWAQGADHTYLGNTVEGSYFEHNIRLATVDRVLIAHNDLRNSPKRTIWSMLADHVYITSNSTHDGRITVGPNPTDVGADLASTWVAIERNICSKIGGNGTVEILAGAEHVIVRNNVIEGPAAPCIAVQGANDDTGRIARDIRMYNNTGTNESESGQFLSVGEGAEDLRLQNNLYVAPNLKTGANQTAIVFVTGTSLAAFDDVRRNVWTIPADFLWIEDGYHYVWPFWSNPNGYKTPTQWEAAPQVTNDLYETVVLDPSFAPGAASFAATHALPVAGVYTDLTGQRRAPTGAWTAGAVELNPFEGDVERGACCLPDLSCLEQETVVQCSVAGGTYLGDDTSCDGVICPRPSLTGACCISNGACADLLTEAQCDLVGGMFQGNTSTCLTIECPQPEGTGACCDAVGICTDGLTPSECMAVGGSYQGDDTTCGDLSCPPPTGACCLPDGSCASAVTIDDCVDGGGTYQGDAVTCGDVTCPQPVTGACCLGDGVCQDGLTSTACANIGGAYQADDVLCADVDCPLTGLGACCFPSGNCVDNRTIENCEEFTGVFQGVGTSCSVIDCPTMIEPGGCCLNDGSCQPVESADDCAALGGVYQGANVPCSVSICPAPTPVGACCFPDGTCLNEQTLESCLNAGGAYAGDDVGCPAANCPQPPATGACCLPNATCDVETSDDCAALGGTYQGDAIDCGDVTCPRPQMACCLPDGSCSGLLSSAICLANGGEFFGPGVSCSLVDCPQPVPTGACCLVNTNCLLETEENCDLVGGVYQGDAIGCIGLNCPLPTGACCLPDGACIIANTDDCSAVSGMFEGVGVLCTTVDCPEPTGACCLPNAACLIQTESGCAGFAGEYQGDDTDCIGLSCPPPTGACCLADTTCVVATVIDCVLLGAAYQGDGVSCSGVNCAPPPSACCLPDGNCDGMLDDVNCAAAGGLYFGDGETCATVDCPFSDPTGACCLPTGLCTSNLTAENCDLLGGDYVGNDTTCVAANCPTPTGACCTPGGLCVGNLSQLTCASAGGSFQGIGSQCVDITCPSLLGACCIVDGTCLNDRLESECNSFGGTYQGANTTCAERSCLPPTGACCLPGGSCADATLDDECDDLGGVYQGDEAECAQLSCPESIGACCLTTGFCFDALTPSTCQQLGGLFQGEDSICNEQGCLPPPVTGACCFTTGACSPNQSKESCLVAGGTYAGNNTTCVDADCPPPPPFGACCYPDGVCLEALSATTCAATAGLYAGDGTPCAAISCEPPPTVGACCLDGGSCVDGLTIDACSLRGGAFQGEDSACLGTTCPLKIVTGSCCLAGGQCINDQRADACFGLGGVYQGDDTFCTSETCVSPLREGGCCLPNGQCLDDVIGAACQTIGGTFIGPNIACGLVLCPTPTVFGACCLANGDCLEAMPASECLGIGGNYQGDDTICAEAMCPLPDPTGACCIDGGPCVEVAGFDLCSMLGGDFYGLGVECVDIECVTAPPPGFTDDFESNTGWTLSFVDAIDGAWSRGFPVGGGFRGDPTSDFDGSGKCYLTGNLSGNSDVDGGPFTLTSPTFSAVEGLFATIEYAVWFSSIEPDGDFLLVEISNDDGETWTEFERLGRTNGWNARKRSIAPVVQPTSAMRVRFSVADAPNNSITEAAVDAFAVVYHNVPQVDDSPMIPIDPPPTPALPIRPEGTVLFADDFATFTGWTIFALATNGNWAHGMPLGSGLYGDPTIDADGNELAMLTNPAAGPSDVDGGPTTLISPLFDISTYRDVTLYVSAWLVSEYDPADRIFVDISNDNGLTWVNIHMVEDTVGWEQQIIPLSGTVPFTTQMRVRFVIRDQPDNSITEAGIDDVIFVAAPPPDSGPTAIVNLDEDFESSSGWLSVSVDGAEGRWERGIPAGDGTRGDPTFDQDASGHCVLTGNAAGNSDVDGGPHDLISPRLDLTSNADPVVSYACWFSTDDQDGDLLDVAISPDDGVTWIDVNMIGNTFGWQRHEFRVESFVETTDSMRLRFRVTDSPNTSITEAAIDAVRIADADLLPPAPPRLAPSTTLSFDTNAGWSPDGHGQTNRWISPIFDGTIGETLELVARGRLDGATLRVLVSNDGGDSYAELANLRGTMGAETFVFDPTVIVVPTTMMRLAFETTTRLDQISFDAVTVAINDDASVIFTPFEDVMDVDTGWLTMRDATNVDGGWERGLPAGTGLRGDPLADLDGGGACYLTANRDDDADVDGGAVQLTSPRMDITGLTTPMLSYGCWFATNTPGDDQLDVFVSNDDGLTWTLVESVTVTSGWQRRGFFVERFVAPTNTMRLRFVVDDVGDDSVTEAAVDSVALSDAISTWPLSLARFNALSEGRGDVWVRIEVPSTPYFKPGLIQPYELPSAPMDDASTVHDGLVPVEWFPNTDEN